MTPRDILKNAVDPAFAMLDALTGIKSDDRARVLVMAIAGQESAWSARLQLGGPARSFWQFEKGGGVVGVLSHPASAERIKRVCVELMIPCNSPTVYEAMAWNDVLAACMARLLLYTDPAPLPNVGEIQVGWQYYLRNWRPGAPHPEAWSSRYATALTLVHENMA